jgi:hypothetical protein
MKPNPEIYLKAAELVASETPAFHYSACQAIMRINSGFYWSAEDWQICRERKAFHKFFKPHKQEAKNTGFWFNEGSLEENQNNRVLALLFMHQIAKNS